MRTLLAELSARFTLTLGSAEAGHLAALEQLRAIAYREASTLAYADAFRTIMIAFLITTPLALLLRKVAAPQKPAANAH
jgi:DHA2 family multidrug resistance protein